MKEPTPSASLNALFPDEQTRSFLIELINSLPNIVAIMGDDRRLVYSNQAMLDAASLSNFEKAYNLRPGDLFNCVNSALEPEGCGASEACALCGALRAMEDSRSTGKKASNECMIRAKDELGVKAFNFIFTSTPFKNNGASYFVVSIEDISNEKRKAELEKIFFHDIINSIGSIGGVLDLLKMKAKADPIHIKILDAVYNTLIDTVNEQKQFSLAESGELRITKKMLHSKDLLEEVSLHFSVVNQYSSVLKIDENSINISFESDEVLLSRILINMIKNAFEASSEDDTITIGAHLISKKLRFSVNNPVFIPRETQLVIFERAFSTKGTGRGLGTFSMKLLGENYLGGNVDFVSSTENGTTFWIDLPLSPSTN